MSVEALVLKSFHYKGPDTPLRLMRVLILMGRFDIHQNAELSFYICK